jgi:outer membrane protein TolC
LLFGLMLASSGCGLLGDDGLSFHGNALPNADTSLPGSEAPTGIAQTSFSQPVSVASDSGPGASTNYQVQRQLADPVKGLETPAIAAPSGVNLMKLPEALALAGVENPVIQLAEQAVQASLAMQMQARVLILPNLNVGSDFNNHTGPLETSFGAIRSVDRQSAYLGLGAWPVGAGTVSYPGVWLYASLGNAFYDPKVAGQVVAQRLFEATATRNNVLLEVAERYLQLAEAEGRLAVIRLTQADFAEIVRLTRAYVEAGQGRQADAERAETAALVLENDECHAQEEVAVHAAELSRLLNLDPTSRLQIVDPIIVVQFVEPSRTLQELLEVAMRSRPEMHALAAEITAAQLRVTQEKVRPFLPTLSVGYSEGGFGGGSNLTAPTFDNLHPRADFDAMAWWTFQNLGLGNAALVKRRKAELGEAESRRGVVLNQIKREVADAFNDSAARTREMETARRQVETAASAFRLDLQRVRGFQGLPIELLDSGDMLYQARQDLLRAIIAFDEAQFRLFVALGQPPTLALVEGQE